MKNFQHGLLSEMEAEWLDQVENTQAGGAPEGPCLKQKPTLRTWPERFVRIEGKARWLRARALMQQQQLYGSYIKKTL